MPPNTRPPLPSALARTPRASVSMSRTSSIGGRPGASSGGASTASPCAPSTAPKAAGAGAGAGGQEQQGGVGSAVCVVLHVRPLSKSEQQEGCEQLIHVSGNGQEVLVQTESRSEAFSCDAAFGADAGGAPSGLLYPRAVAPLVEGVFSGIHGTVFAYGQTGAGKSFTLGTHLERYQDSVAALYEDDEAAAALLTSEAPYAAGPGPSPGADGGVPRRWRPVAWEAIDDACARAQALRDKGVDVTMLCSFIEIHQDSIRDLLSNSRGPRADGHHGGAGRLSLLATGSSVASSAFGGGGFGGGFNGSLSGSFGATAGSGQGTPRMLAYRDPDPSKDVVLVGLEEVKVTERAQLMQCLIDGMRARTTAATNANAHSSRSHAIFTIRVRQTSRRILTVERSSPGGVIRSRHPSASGQRATPRGSSAQDDGPHEYVEETLEAKLHLVDLAGSERVGKSGVQGARLLEACSINQGLHALGHVIDALADKRKHVPYRDHILTRLLRNALGGNSRTVMCACVSPADVHLSETLGTLRYAARARAITNMPVVNSARRKAELGALRQENEGLREQVKALAMQLEQLTSAPGPSAAELAASLAEARAELEAESAAGALQEARLAQLAAQLREMHLERLHLAEVVEALRVHLLAAQFSALEANAKAGRAFGAAHAHARAAGGTRAGSACSARSAGDAPGSWGGASGGGAKAPLARGRWTKGGAAGGEDGSGGGGGGWMIPAERGGAMDGRGELRTSECGDGEEEAPGAPACVPAGLRPRDVSDGASCGGGWGAAAGPERHAAAPAGAWDGAGALVASAFEPSALQLPAGCRHKRRSCSRSGACPSPRGLLAPLVAHWSARPSASDAGGGAAARRRSTAAGAMMAAALEASEGGAGPDWGLRRQQAEMQHGQEGLQRRAAAAAEARARLEATVGSVLAAAKAAQAAHGAAAPGDGTGSSGGGGGCRGGYAPADVAAAAAKVAAACGAGPAAGGRFFEWAVQITSQQAELAVMIEAERAQRRLVKEQLDATLAAAESARAAVAEPAAAQAASVVQSSGGAAEPSGEADGDAAPAAAADEALAACQGEATEAAPGEPAAGVTNATPAAAAAVAAVAAADAAEVARLERRARDLRQRLAAHTAALRALLDLQQQLEPLRLDAAVATDEESSLCERRVAAILSGGRAEPAEGEEEGEGAPLAHVLWSHALSLGLAPWQAFASLLSAAAALRARAERLRMRGEEAEAEVSLQRRLGAVAAEEAAAKEAAAEGLRRELAAAKASLTLLEESEARCHEALARVAEAHAAEQGLPPALSPASSGCVTACSSFSGSLSGCLPDGWAPPQPWPAAAPQTPDAPGHAAEPSGAAASPQRSSGGGGECGADGDAPGWFGWRRLQQVAGEGAEGPQAEQPGAGVKQWLRELFDL